MAIGHLSVKDKANFFPGIVDFWIPEKSRSLGGDLLRKGRLLVISCLGVCMATLAYLVFYLWIGHLWGSGICLYGGISALGVLIYFRKTGNLYVSGNFFAFSAYVFFVAFSVSSYGFRTAIPGWMIMVPTTATLLADRKSGVFWGSLSVLFLVVLYFLDDQLQALPALFPEKRIPLVSMASTIGLVTYMALAISNNETWRERYVEGLYRAREEIGKQNREIHEQQILLEKKNREILTMNMNLERDASRKVKKLEESKQDLDTFFYESSHALRRPLTRIMGLMNLIRSDMDKEQFDLLKEHLTVTGKRMDILLRSLVNVSEMTTYSPEITEVHLAEVVDEVWEIVLHQEVRGASFKLENRTPKELSVRCDRNLLSMVLENLLDNSVKYGRSLPPGGPRIRITTREVGAWIEFRIWDNGLGIHPKVIPTLFNLFVRGTEKSTGSGLGLYAVKKMVEKMEGEISVESEMGEYTEFTLRLPQSHNQDGQGIWRAG